MKRKYLSCALALALVCSSLQSIAYAASEPASKPALPVEMKRSKSGEPLTEEEEQLIAMTMFSNFVFEEFSWKDGDKLSEIIEYWRDGKLIKSKTQSINRLPPDIAQGGNYYPAGNTRILYAVEDPTHYPNSGLDRIIVRSLTPNGSGSAYAFPIDPSLIGSSSGNRYNIESLKKGQKQLILESIYSGRDANGRSNKKEKYAIRIYLKCEK